MKLKLFAVSFLFSVIQVFSQENPALEYFNAGVELMENQKFEEAIEPFSKAIDLNPANITFFYHRGYSFFKMMDFHSARSDFKICVGVVPRDPDYNFFLGLSESKLDNFVEALKYFNKAISMNQSNHAYYFHRGIVHLKGNDYVSSLSDFNSSISLNPNHILSYYNRGQANYKLGRINNACIDWKIALDASSNLSVEHFNATCPNVNLDEWHELQLILNGNYIVKPAFQGGSMDSFTKFVMENIRYPRNFNFQLNESRAIAQFVIGATGSIDGIEILNSASKEIEEEVRRVIEASDRMWEGGTVNGIPSDFKTSIFLNFISPETLFKIKEYEKSGDESFEKNEFDSAINFYTKAIELDSRAIEIQKKRINALIRNGNSIPAEINSTGLGGLTKTYYRYNIHNYKGKDTHNDTHRNVKLILQDEVRPHKQVKVYYDNDWLITSEKNATFHRISLWDLNLKYFTGEFKDYYNDGTLVSEGTHWGAKTEGKYVMYYKNGNPYIEGQFHNSEPEGLWTFYYPSGLKYYVIEFINDNFTLIELYDSDGKSLMKSRWFKFTIAINNTYSLKGSYRNGKRNRIWRYKSNKDVILKERYLNDEFSEGFYYEGSQTFRLSLNNILPWIFTPLNIPLSGDLVFKDDKYKDEYPFIH